MFLVNTAMKIEGKAAQEDVYLEYKDKSGSVSAASPAVFDRTYIWHTENGNNGIQGCDNLVVSLF